MSPQVLIAGAGPTGLTLAIDLARRGVEVRIVDRAAEFFAGSRGDGIQPRTLEVFDDLGVLDAVRAAARPPAPMHVYLGGEFATERRMFEPREATPAVPYPNPLMLGQSDTERLLRDRLADFGVRVELSTALADFTQDGSGVTATLAGPGGPETVRADYLVGADGGRSTVRRVLGIPFEGTTDESIRMLLGDVRIDALDHTYGYWFAEPDAPMTGIALSPLPGGRLFQFAAPLTDDVEPTRALLQSYVERFTHRTDLRIGELAWSTVWRPNVRLAQRFRDGRAFLAGDAAHAHPPTGGQGMNTGIQDAYNLGWKLAAALRGGLDLGNAPLGPDALLDSYETERRAVAARVLGISTGLMEKHVAGDEDAMRRGPETQQLDITYRTADSSGPLVSGDRAPDAPLRRADGTPVRLFDLFRGPHATLLSFDGSGPNAEGIEAYSIIGPGATPSDGRLVAVDGHAFADYAAGAGTRVLVRPDGYVAWRTDVQPPAAR
ncbi:2-polyprenyl-6-methoxyphenol hydroxylase-like FAD-dependent oxidoreductase [Nocardia transvalensis]|uniref:2-polyprenyl-6-methoxyphenol hydroxylase-like FAD-dependent oxidoreductase n=1 Tax=Nocardia transvalensis TaxID=37333 RepID=A0A7W9PGS2_9NOCA|nr:FAD-dependent monooxygenase [Nocardia transvalensis]MBB5915896.1 2-polyprenyl-6-methoxyphenol hydroxylase-like FAD-dependent oxidoreductase [Nocardia transvalensis]